MTDERTERFVAIGRSESEAIARVLRELSALREEVRLEIQRTPEGWFLAEGILQERRASVRLVEQFLALVAKVLLPEIPTRVILSEVTDKLVRFNIQADRRESLGALIGKRGYILQAITTLASEIFRFQGDRRKVIVDAGGYLRRKESRLREVFLQALERARKSGLEVDLGPMSAEDRQIIYALADKYPDARIRTVGSGQERRIIVFVEGQPPSESPA